MEQAPLTWPDVLGMAMLLGTVALVILAFLATVLFVGFLAIGGYTRTQGARVRQLTPPAPPLDTHHTHRKEAA